MKSGTKMVDFKVHDSACQPAAGWVQGVRGGERQRYYPSVPRGNLFAFESEDKFVLTCSPQLAVVYQVRTCACTCGVIVYLVGLSNKTGFMIISVSDCWGITGREHELSKDLVHV